MIRAAHPVRLYVQSPRQSGREGDVPESVSQVCAATPTGHSILCVFSSQTPAMLHSQDYHAVHFCPACPLHGLDFTGTSTLQAQARLWEGLSALSERLDVLHAALRELVVRRFRDRDVAAVEAGRFGDVDFLPADEEPGFQEQWQQNRSDP